MVWLSCRRYLAGIPSAVGNFFTGLGEGAGVYGFLDWTAPILGLALFLSALKGLKSGSIVGPIIRGAIRVALIGWAVS